MLTRNKPLRDSAKNKHRKSARQPIFGAFFYLDLTQLVALNYAETARMVLFGKILYCLLGIKGVVVVGLD